MTSATVIAILLTGLQVIVSVFVMGGSSQLLPDYLSDAWEEVGRTLPVFLDLNLARQPQSSMARAHLVEVFSAILSDQSVEVWLLGCNAISFGLVAGVHSLLLYPPSGARRLAGTSVLVVPALTLWVVLESPFRVIASLAVFWGSQLVGWKLWAGTSVPERRISDVTKCWQANDERVPYDPAKYFDLRRGIFVGLNEANKPVYVLIREARQHLELMGQTRFGKTVFANLLVIQFLMLDECCVVVDPKRDKFMPGVLWKAAREQGRLFHLIDLQCELPQLNPFAGCTVREREELLIQNLDLVERGDMSDIYFLLDRQAARLVAQLEVRSLPELLQKAAQIQEVVEAKRFYAALTELCTLPAVQTVSGANLTEVVGAAGLIYVVGSTDHEPTIRLQKLIFHRITQVIREKGLLANSRWTAVFLDEFKYVLSPGVLQALGVIADRNCHLLLAHQALGDLKDCRNLPPSSVESIIKTNSGFKCLFRTSDPDSALWASKVSGTIPSYSELAQKTVFRLGESGGSWKEAPAPLFDANDFLTLPRLQGIILGVGVPQKIRVHYLPEGERPIPKAAERVNIDPPELI